MTALSIDAQIHLPMHRRASVVRVVSRILSFIVVLLCAVPAGATIYYVSSSGSDSCAGVFPDPRPNCQGPFRTLAHALSKVAEGDTVQLRAGTYPESVYRNGLGSRSSPVTITRYGSENVIMARGSNTFSLFFDNSSVVIRGLAFTSGGLVLRGSANSLVESSSFVGNTDSTPLYAEDTSGLTVNSNLFQHNRYTTTLVISGRNSGTVDVSNNTFENNYVLTGATSVVLLVANASGPITISGNELFNTTPPSQIPAVSPGNYASAIMIFQSMAVTVDGNSIRDFRFRGTNDDTAINPSYLKTPAQGGENGHGISVIGSAPVVFESVTITNNTIANCSQDGIVFSDVRDSLVAGNTVTHCGRCGIFLTGIEGDPTQVVRNRIERNVTSGNGWLHGGASGISIIHGGSHNIIRRNFSFQNKNGTAGTVGADWYGDGNGIIADLRSHGTIIENNLSVGNEGAGISVNCASNVAILNNTVVGNGYCPHNGDNYGIFINGGDGDGNGATVVNNLIYNNRRTQFMVWKSNLDHEVHHNLYSVGPLTAADQRGSVIEWGGVRYSLAQWQNFAQGSGNAVGSIQVVPRFAGDVSQMIPENFGLIGTQGPGAAAPLSDFTSHLGYLIDWDYSESPRHQTTPTIGAFEAAAVPPPAARAFDGSVVIDNTWMWVDWFGFASTPDWPWIWHQGGLGYLYCIGHSNTGLWMYASEMLDWLWMTRDSYPLLYSTSAGSWLWYVQGSTNPRWFYNYSTGHWISR